MNRLSDSELEVLLNDVESHRVERKESFAARDAREDFRRLASKIAGCVNMEL